MLRDTFGNMLKIVAKIHTDIETGVRQLECRLTTTNLNGVRNKFSFGQLI